MSENTHQPREDDAVLGGEVPPPLQSAILGGIEGVKKRLASPLIEAQVAAVREALNYGDAGLDLIIGALENDFRQVRQTAHQLLRESSDERAIQALRKYKFWDGFDRLYGLPYSYATTFANRKVEEFDLKNGAIADPVGTAIALRAKKTGMVKIDEIDAMTYAIAKQLVNDYWDFNEWNHQKIEDNIIYRLAKLIQKPQISKLEAFVIGFCGYYYYIHPSVLINAIVKAHKQLTSLKALFIGDIEDREIMISSIEQSDISPVLAVYPNLEVLKIRGGRGLAFSPWYHNQLKALTVETGGLDRETINQLCELELPSLEYLELWVGRYEYGGTSSIVDLMPIISGEVFPKLKYLGLRNCQYSDEIAFAIVESPLIHRLSELDLSMGTLGEAGAEALLNCPDVNQLDTLNVSYNYLSGPKNVIQQLSQLNCQVIANEQQSSLVQYRYCYVGE